MIDRDQLPIPDYDHLPLEGLKHRIRMLTADQLRALLEYEREHAHRLPVIQVFQERLRALESGEARPSDGSPWDVQAEHPPPPSGGSPANPAQTQVNNQPLRHGVYTATPNRDIRGR
ncbi:hypothetical protein ACVGVM_09030 [Pseudonocardia bannensis]|uniref:hypothetical protein n=1 Tax=Pseudonocardia bannensis TaxID=630973 RepID=UPI001B7D29D1|nr:hypothetical protein [Pseudonocardia bannensis]